MGYGQKLLVQYLAEFNGIERECEPRQAPLWLWGLGAFLIGGLIAAILWAVK